MVIRQLLGEGKGWNPWILGTEISSGTIEKAREARYSARSIRNLPEPYARYFQADPNDSYQVVLDPQIVRMVQFEVHSLLDKHRTWKDMDVIFCRNGLIYFDAPTRQKVLAAKPSAPAPVSEFAPGVEAAAGGRNPALNLKARRYVLRLDSGLRDIDQDLQNTLIRAIECLEELSAGTEQLSKAQELNGQTRAAVAGASQQLMRLLTLLQVGDRTYQKIEALRVLLQEFSDHLFQGDAVAPDLRVKTQVYDQNLIPKGDEEEGESIDKPLSQKDIDALFA